MSRTPTYEEVAAEMKATMGHPIAIQLDPAMAVFLCGILQLALRHPQVQEPTRQRAEQFISGLASAVAEVSPILGDAIKTGWGDRV